MNHQKSDHVGIRFDYIVEETVARDGSLREIKRKQHSWGIYKEIDNFLDSINWEKDLNEDDGECEYTVFFGSIIL